ncbi:hypothetical protein [Dactylosporangium matsuzakiense]|uniref:Uncharacterized protein n=1 Tax=Dactylosporangium matsuzakiense TaxID=53360 RepID=A0A9W6KHC4_9ACTN|nr:hypothetical protein [Dactylosporangium matsuzakiense]UWZ45876.1 hypothetical protein Dmats_05175 [Dactylosporangium matsuzakiense]GLL00095.1 hypothetical protein GCM10017581_018350 [Dactylosporangium matsuzakiense]
MLIGYLARAVRFVLDLLERGAPYAAFCFVWLMPPPTPSAPEAAVLERGHKPAPLPAAPDRRSYAPPTPVELELWADFYRRDTPRWRRWFAGTGGTR